MKWLFLVHQVQTPNSRERVAVWRLTKKVGAILYRNSVYVLPYNKERLEDFQWLCQQIRDLKGEASVFVSEADSPKEDHALRELFETDREKGFSSLQSNAERLLARLRPPNAQLQLTEAQTKRLKKEFEQLKETFVQLQRINFFSNKSAKNAGTVIQQISQYLRNTQQSGISTPVGHYSRKIFHGKTWATRKHIHIDRLCSAWLIRRFIDSKAKFTFVPEAKFPKGAIPFDAVGAEFSHHGDDCTFETLLKVFQIKDRALHSIAQIVHDIDLKDQKFGRPEAEGIDVIVRSLSDSLRDDHKVLEIGWVMLDSLYKHFLLKKTKTK